MAKKNIKDKKNQEAQKKFMREAKLMGYKEDDPLVKEALEKVIEIKGSSMGRKKMIEQQLLTLRQNIELQSKGALTAEEIEKIIKDRVKEATDDITKNNEELIEKLAAEKAKELYSKELSEVLEKLENLSKQTKSVEVVVVNNYIEKESMISKTYNATKEATINAAEKVKEVTVNAAEKTKEVAGKGAGKVKSFGSKFKENAIKQKNKQINHVLTFFEKVKGKTKEAKNKVKNKIIEYKNRTKDLFADLAPNEDYTLTIYKARMVEQAKVLADSFRIDFDNEEMGYKVSNEINKILDEEDLSGIENVNEYIIGRIEDLYKTHNIEFMQAQREKKEAQKQNEQELETKEPEVEKAQTKEVETPEIKEPEVETPEVKEPEVETPEVKEPEVKTPEVKEPEVETPEVKEPEVETPEVKEPEVETPEAKEPEVDSNHQFMLGDSKLGFWYYEMANGDKMRVYIMDGKINEPKKISEEEYNKAKAKFLNQNKEVTNDKDKDKHKVVDADREL